MTTREKSLLAARGMVAAVAAASLIGVAGCSSDAGPGQASTTPVPTPSAQVKVGGSVVATAGSSNEMDVVVPDPIKDEWGALGAKGTGVELIEVGGDGRATTVPTALGDDREASAAAMTDALNALDATAPGRSALAGLNAVKSPASAPIWVFSPLLDTKAPLDFSELAFDESPNTIVKAVKKADQLPTLKGRTITFVVTPVAGQQKKLSKLQVGYQRAVWEGIARAGGAKKVTFFDGTGTTPGMGTIPAIPIPDPNDKINAEKKGKTSTCTLPSPALFVSDQATLIDKKATLKALKECIGDLDASTTITVEGHTSGYSGSDNEFTKSLSVRRATEVAALLRELDVPAKNITKVTGYGSSKPLVEPSNNPKNRAVVVTFTSSS